MNNNFENEISKWLRENLKPMSEKEIEERREEVRKEEKLKERYMLGIEKRFLSYARSLPGREYETINDPLMQIVGNIENGKIINLRVLPESKVIEESLKRVFNNENKEYFSITKNGQINIESNELPSELNQMINYIITPDNEEEKEVSGGEIDIKIM